LILKLRCLFALCAFAFALSAFGSWMPKLHVTLTKSHKSEILQGRLLIKLRAKKGGAGLNSIGSVTSLPRGSAYLTSIGTGGWTLWSIPTNIDPRKAAAAAIHDSAVAFAQPVNRVSALLPNPNDADYGVQESDPSVVIDLTNSGITFPRLWYLNETFARQAWDVFPAQYFTAATKPTSAQFVALIDSGCDRTHPDFINVGGASSDSAVGGQLNWALSRHFSNGVPDAAPWDDDNGHGTHMAGLALAAANNGGYNGHGVAGTGYSAQGMILKVLDQTGNGTDADSAAAILYAADHGADVISLSLGTVNYSQILQDAVTYAWQKGCLIVAAANEDQFGGGDLGPVYPAACSGVLAVSANGPNFAPASDYSGSGFYVDISAPGGDIVNTPGYILFQYIWSTAMTTPGGLGSLFDQSSRGDLYPIYGVDYAYLAGTSLSAAQVSGAAALYYGAHNLRQGQGHVNMRAYRALERSAQGNLGAPNGSWEPVQGYGSLNALNLVLDSDTRGSTVGAIEGIVYFGGTPAGGISMTAQRNGFPQTYPATTKFDGQYRFDALPPGQYTITATPSGVPKQRQAIVSSGSDATGVDFWVNGNPAETTPPVVPIFTVNTVSATSVALSQWGYDTETGIDTLKVRIGSSPGLQDVYPDTEIVTETTNNTISGLSLTSGVPYYLRAVYTNGIGLQTTVDRTVMFGPATVRGTLTFQDYGGAPVQVTVLIRNPGSLTTLQTITFTPAANGNFSFLAPGPGTYDMAFKASHWLRKSVANVTVTAFGASGLTPSLTNGDINGDNVISLGDFTQLRTAFGSQVGDGNYSVNADLNGNGNVSLSDFTILRNRFGSAGDP
jgi:hypothetical protein